MVFTSPTFLFGFLPLFLAGYYLLPARGRTAWMLAASWLFYGWWRLDMLALLIVTSLGGAALGAEIARVRIAHPRRARTLLAAGVTATLLVLGWYKYAVFGARTLAAIVGASPESPLSTLEVVLPVGISFFTFQIISYLVDVYRGTAQPATSIFDVAAYISLFPQLVAGPIVRYGDIADELRSRTHDPDRIAAGAGRFAIGLARKLLVADVVAPVADAAFALAAPSTADAWLGLAAYTLQIYFDFAAYSDMAIGLGAMIGFTFPENFRMPYHSASITEFWRRWHMTLSTWLRDYLYIPLGGSRRGARRTLVNLATVMVLGGLWHGASWNFVLWGAWHGALLIGERRAATRYARTPVAVRRAVTLLAVMVGWVLFRAPTLAEAGVLYRALAGFGAAGFAGGPLSAALLWQLDRVALAAVPLAALLAALEPALQRGARRFVRLAPALVAFLFGISLVRMLAASYSPFLYFQF